MEFKLEDVKLLKLQPGDTLVLKCPQILHAEQRELILGVLQKAAPKGTKCLVLDLGMDLEVIRAQQ